MVEKALSLSIDLDIHGRDHFASIPIHLNSHGDILLVKGPNGVGKSTLLKTLCGHYAPQGRDFSLGSGRVSYCGAQTRGMLYHLTGRENLNLYFRYQGIKEIPDFEDFFTHENYLEALTRPFKDCSSGMKKMLLLSYSLLLPANYYILDEPLVHLDQRASEEVLQKIAQRLKDASFILVDHTEHIQSRFECQELSLGDYRSEATKC